MVSNYVVDKIFNALSIWLTSAAAPQFQILGAVIVLYPVLMVNILAIGQCSAERLLHESGIGPIAAPIQVRAGPMPVI